MRIVQMFNERKIRNILHIFGSRPDYLCSSELGLSLLVLLYNIHSEGALYIIYSIISRLLLPTGESSKELCLKY